MTCYFLQADYDALLERIEDLREKIKDRYKTVVESAEQSSETWHDNYEHEEGQRQIAMLGQRLESLVAVVNAAEMVTPEVGDQVDIGARVTTEDVESGELRTYAICGFMCLTGAEDAISYTSPIAKSLMGAKVGEIREITTGPTTRSLRIMKIE
ncbi:MAG: GreA/GreB family elongation factor [Patescibacteria group bacterium]|nr:GreA/GreB family elongation factor [Patescibacteria group bacterium]